MSDEPIASFYSQHADALTSTFHPEHKTRVEELTRLHMQKFENGTPEPEPHPVQDDSFQVMNATIGAEMEAQVAPLLEPAPSPEAYTFKTLPFPEEVRIGDGTEKMQVGFDKEQETVAREWMFGGELTPAEGTVLEHVYRQELDKGFTQQRGKELEAQTMRHLQGKYGEASDAAVRAAAKVAWEIEAKTPGLMDFLEHTNLGNHFQVVEQLIQVAVKRGYFKGA